MSYNDSLDEYMKKRQNEFRKDYLQFKIDSRRLSNKERLNRFHELREKYIDLILFKHINKKTEPKVLKKVQIDENLKVRTYYKKIRIIRKEARLLFYITMVMTLLLPLLTTLVRVFCNFILMLSGIRFILA